MSFFAHGQLKPPLGFVQVNPDHPFAIGHVLTALFNTPLQATGSIPLLASVQHVGTNSNGTNGSTREGAAITFGATTQYVSFGAGDAIGLPTAAITVLIVRRKLDTTARTSAMLNYQKSLSSNTEVLNLHLPWSDGIVYWDFGGQAGANRLSVASLSFSATTPERWVLTAGPQGSAIWQNGIKVASQATAISRSAGGSDLLYLNHSTFVGATGDLQAVNFLSIINGQWSDALCQWWSAEPYAHLYTEAQRTYVFLASGGPTAVSGVGTATGTATVLGVGAYRTGGTSGKHSGFGSQKPSRRLHGTRKR